MTLIDFAIEFEARKTKVSKVVLVSLIRPYILLANIFEVVLHNRVKHPRNDEKFPLFVSDLREASQKVFIFGIHDRFNQ